MVDIVKLLENFNIDFDCKVMFYVLCNLLCNVFKYVSQQIIVSVELIDDCILIYVDDDGIGILLEECEYIFLVFICFDCLCDCVIGGYGFGLVIVCCVFEFYGGSVIVNVVLFGGVCFILFWKVY